MSTTEHSQVGLFIDWDNLAISTAADLGGATPDIRAIVQKAQQYGRIIVARAYSEWTASSDRLAVYRAGIEPVYAPTFRFEPDTVNSLGKGKSLADPCMVADFVDTLHLLPDIKTYVIVTGDKDMIPVVRLAQLRGRRIIVIGPDYVAGVLREMADEFVPYRSLVELVAGRPATEPARRYGGARPSGEEGRRRTAERRQPSAPAVLPQEKIAAQPSNPLPISTFIAPASSSKARDTAEPRAVAETGEWEPELTVERPADDLQSVFATIVDLLRRRKEEGRDRIRATNLKDALMQRLPGFSERRYGFSKFKDLLTGAEKVGLIKVIIAGPVHWISLPEGAELPKPEAAVDVQVAATAESPPEDGSRLLEERRSEIIRFLFELRDRSRWLTYTYVLTNLITFFGKTVSQATAESHARAALNYLMDQGVLHIDKEPQEVEVGGARHRVRMCHVDTTHELVAEALGYLPGEAASIVTEPEEAGTRQVEAEASPILSSVAIWPMPEFPQVSTEGENRTEEALGDAEEFGPEVESIQKHEPLVRGNGSSIPTAHETTTAETREAQSVDRPEIEDRVEGKPVEAGATAIRLQRAFAALNDIVREGSSIGKPLMSASNLRGKLIRALGGFNERQLGFARFKDFLAAAEKAGMVRILVRGHVTWVGTPEGGTTVEVEHVESSPREP